MREEGQNPKSSQKGEAVCGDVGRREVVGGRGEGREGSCKGWLGNQSVGPSGRSLGSQAGVCLVDPASPVYHPCPKSFSSKPASLVWGDNRADVKPLWKTK